MSARDRDLVTLGVIWTTVAGWWFSPIDLLPDVLPVVGLADDVLALGLGLGASAFVAVRWFERRGAALSAGAAPRAVGGESWEPLDADEIRGW